MVGHFAQDELSRSLLKEVRHDLVEGVRHFDHGEMATVFENDETRVRDSAFECFQFGMCNVEVVFSPDDQRIKAGAESFFKSSLRSSAIWLSALLFAAKAQVSMPGKLANAFAFDASCQ